MKRKPNLFAEDVSWKVMRSVYRFGCRSFHMCGPTIRNKLPQNLRSADTMEQFKRISLTRCSAIAERRRCRVSFGQK